jgi:hypothetical protein
VTVNTGVGTGNLDLDLIDNDTILDVIGNRLGGSGATNGNFTAGETYSVDNNPPAVLSIVRASTNPSRAASVNYTVTFSKPVTGVDQFDFSIVTTGSLSGVAITSVGGTGATRTVTVSTGGNGSGTIHLDLIDNDTIRDSSLVQLGGAGLGNGSFTTGQDYTIDKTPPTVLSIVRGSANPTTASTVTFIVTFSEGVTGVDGADFTVVNAGTTVTSATITSVGGANGTATRTVTVSSITGTGTLRLDLIDNDSIRDSLTNRLGGTGSGNGNFTTGEFYTKN